MKRRSFLKRSVFGSVMLAFPWSSSHGNYPVDKDGKPIFPKSLEVDHESKAKAATVTNARLRWMIQRFNAEKIPGMTRTHSVRVMWQAMILPMLRQEPEYFVAIRNYYKLDTTDGWVRREMERDYK